MTNIQKKWKNVHFDNECRKSKLIEGLLQYKDSYKDKIAFNSKAFKAYNWLAREITAAECNVEDKGSILNQVVSEAIQEYNLEFSVSVFRWHNLYSEASRGMDMGLMNKIVDRYQSLMTSDDYNVYYSQMPTYPTKEIDNIFALAMKKRNSKSPRKKGSKAKKKEQSPDAVKEKDKERE
jgi:hypothetical protein